MLKLLPILFLIIQFTMVFATPPQIDIQSDSLEYDMEKEFISAEGNVVINYNKINMTANIAQVDIKERKIYLSGDVTVERENIKIKLSSGSYADEIDTVSGFAASGRAGQWIFYTDEIISTKSRQLCKKSSLTSCDLKKPHYKITSTRMSISPDEFISVYNAVFYIGKIPVFYLPYWFRSLKKQRLNVSMEPGYNSIDGAFLKTIISYNFSDFLESKFLIDTFSKRGVGKGLETNYNIPAQMKSTIYLYHIKEDTTFTERWRAKAYLWRRIPKFWAVHSEASFISDERFNQSYYTESWNPVEREINSNLFFTRQTDFTNLRIGASQRSIFDPEKNHYIQKNITVPSVEYLIYKRKKYLGFYPEFSAHYKRVSHGQENPYLSDFQSRLTMTSQIRILKNLTLSPNFGFQSNYFEVAKDTFQFIGRYSGGGSVRYTPFRLFSLDAGYSYRHRSLSNTLAADPDGIEENLLNMISFFEPTSYLRLRTASGYNFLAEKKLPLSNELNINYKKNLIILRHQQSLEPFKYDNSQLFYSYSDIFSLNFNHNDTAPQKVDGGITFKIYPTKKTIISYSMSGSFSNNIYDTRSHQLIINRDLHCWEGQFTFRSRKIKEDTFLDEFFIQLNLKTGDFLPPSRTEIEKEFYPWR